MKTSIRHHGSISLQSRAGRNRRGPAPSLVCGLSLFLLTFLVSAPAAAALTGAARLAAVYDLILNAGFDAARAQLATACPPAPAEACLALEAVAIWWEIQLDPDNRRLDTPLQATTARAVEAAEQWTRREPERAEAWFYLAGARAPLVQWRVLRGQRLAAAREGKAIKETLERALALDPALHDAHFGIGLYRYYADVAPAAFKALRWLLLLPGGDRQLGLRERLQARDEGELLGSEADYQLHWVYLWYENDPRTALSLLARLHDRYRSNLLFLERIADVQDEYLHDHHAIVASWQALIARDREARLAYPRLARAYLQLGREYSHLDDRDRAVAALDSAITIASREKNDVIRDQARALRKKF